MTKYFLFGGFILMVIAQLYSPAKMIFDKEKVIDQGEAFRFKTAPIDPNDPFRGKYVRLNFDNFYIVDSEEEGWQHNEQVYVSFGSDSLGFAMVQRVSKQEPENEHNYIRLKLIKRNYSDNNTYYFNLPFDRFYMEESKARPAELAFNSRQRDRNEKTYALVNILDGKYVLTDVLIEGVPLKEIAERKIEEDQN